MLQRAAGAKPPVGRRRDYLMLGVFVVLQGLLTRSLHRDDRGATAVEYCLIVALIAIVIVTAVAAVGTKVNTLFNSAVNAL